MVSARKKRGSWIVRMRCVVVKDVVVEDCTEEEARTQPWDHAESETEVEQIDWQVQKVTKNK